MEKCYTCEEGDLTNKKVPYKLYGQLMGKFSAKVCDKCDETFFDEKTSKKITKIVKTKGLWSTHGILRKDISAPKSRKVCNYN